MTKNKTNIAVKGSSNFDASFWREVVHGALEKLASSLIQEEINQIKNVQLWGSQPGFIRVLGAKMSIQKPRARSQESEVNSEIYKKMQSKAEWTEEMTGLLMGGLATRNFDQVGKVVGEHYGLSKSNVSRYASQGQRYYYDQLMKTDCSDVVAIMADGIHYGRDGKFVVVAVLGITNAGEKKLLGIWAGGTENSSIVKSLLDNLIGRGLEKPYLAVIDGSKALMKGLKDQWDDVIVARCHEHKRRNFMDHFGESEKSWAKRRFEEIIYAETYEEGHHKGIELLAELKRKNDSAFKSLSNGFEEMLIPLLIENEGLRRFFSTTNPMESIFSMLRQKTNRVKRWRKENTLMYWLATAYHQQKKNLNKIRGYRAVDELKFLGDRLKKVKRAEVVEFKPVSQEIAAPERRMA